MQCPKCEKGVLEKIQFTNDKKEAFLCDVCESMWFVGETITATTGHVLRGYQEGKGMEYSFIDTHEKDQDHQPVLTNEGDYL